RFAGQSFEMTGKASKSTRYPVTENWQKAIGSYDIWSSASVKVSGKKMTMTIVVHAEDRFNFNRGATDVFTGTPDDINGRFAELGWASGFNTHGRLTREVTWYVGQPEGASLKNPAIR
ncbi:MAG TPA: hypothetical protein VGJ95_24545, partial [Pseudonocardiaceae bacterium]